MQRLVTLSLLLAAVLLVSAFFAPTAAAGIQATPCEALEAMRNSTSKYGNNNKNATAGGSSKKNATTGGNSNNNNKNTSSSSSQANFSASSLNSFLVPNAPSQSQNTNTKGSSNKSNTTSDANAAIGGVAAAMTGVVIVWLM